MPNLRKLQESNANIEDKSAISRDILSDITSFSKYAKYLPSEMKREDWTGTTVRNMQMHMDRYPDFADEIGEAYSSVLSKHVFPSMRSLQFGGVPIELSPNRMFNCAYTACDAIEVFSEMMFLLLGGSGVGFSVQEHHIDKLPGLLGPKKDNGKKIRKKRYLIGDSIEGWADAIKVLMEAYFLHKNPINFDYRDIRKKGALLITSGGKAPGPQPLKDCIHNLRKVMDNAITTRGSGTQLTSVEVYDMCCFIADAVLAGGIRRAALIALFSFTDEDMFAAKQGDWWEKNPQRGRANNSVVLLRHKIKKKDFDHVWQHVKASGAGEPGIYFTNDKDIGCNPCCEIALKSNSFCNLTTTNVSDVKTQEDLNQRVKHATLIGTLQASYTDFHYLRDEWKYNSDKEALLGVSMTGIGSGNVLKLDVQEAARVAVAENKRVAKILGIKPAARVTCIKPEGTASLVAGTSSGVHAWHSPHYIRRMRLGKDEALYTYLKKRVPGLLEDEYFNPTRQSVLSIPIKAPRGSIYRTESELDLLNRVKFFHDNWIVPGHNKGSNTHNVSVTVSIRDNKWDEVGEWMWKNRDSYNGISVLPFDGGTYKQPPFEECDKKTYEDLLNKVKDIDLNKVKEEMDYTDLSGEVACSGGACEITKV